MMVSLLVHYMLLDMIRKTICFVLCLPQRAFLMRKAGASIRMLYAQLASVETRHSICTGQIRIKTGHTTSWQPESS